MIKQLSNGLWQWGSEKATFSTYEECLKAHKVFHKLMSADVRPEGNGKFTFTFSSPGVDRDHDTINQLGIDLKEFKKNPVVIWAHDYSLPPVARVESTWVRDGKLMGSISFPPKGVHALADTLHGLVEHGFLNAVSVGFTPIEVVQREDGGHDYKQIELMELSLVPVPSNREALIQATAKGVNVNPVSEWAANILSAERRSEIDEIKKSLDRIEKSEGLSLARVEQGLSDLVLGLKALADELEEIDEEDVEDKPKGDPPRSEENFSEHNLDRPVKSDADGLDEGGDPAVEEAEEVKTSDEGEEVLCPKCRVKLGNDEANEGEEVKMDHECPELDDEEEAKKRSVAAFSKQLTEITEAFRLVSNVQHTSPAVSLPVSPPQSMTAEQLSDMVKQAMSIAVRDAIRAGTGRLD